MLAKYFYMLFSIFLNLAFYSLTHCIHTRTYIRVMIKTYVFDVCICGARNEEDQFLLSLRSFFEELCVLKIRHARIIYERTPRAFFTCKLIRQVTGNQKKRCENMCSASALICRQLWCAHRLILFLNPRSRLGIIVNIFAQKNRSEMTLISFES